jgi:hypothetical protein
LLIRRLYRDSTSSPITIQRDSSLKTETVDFSISETIRRKKHVLTDAEHREQDAWRKKQEQAARRNSWDGLFFGGPRFPEWDYHPTGQLSFEFEHVYVLRGLAPRRSFRDAKVQRLENMASDIAVGLAVLAAAKTEERRWREAAQQKAEEERQRRQLAARIKHVEDRRTSELEAILSELDKLDRLRRLIAMLNAAASAETGSRLSAFLAWAKEHLAKREDGFSPSAVEDRFAKEHLFGGDDDHNFSSTDPQP